MPKRTSSFRAQLLKDLLDPREATLYINAALEDSEEMFLVALRDVAEARQMARVASEAGVAREALYRMLSDSGNPTTSNLRGILKAIGLKMVVEPIATVAGKPETGGSADQVDDNTKRRPYGAGLSAPVNIYSSFLDLRFGTPPRVAHSSVPNKFWPVGAGITWPRNRFTLEFATLCLLLLLPTR